MVSQSSVGSVRSEWESLVEFELLGPLVVRVDGREIDTGPPKQRALLAVLLLSANEMVSVDQMIDAVWGESPPRTVEHSIQVYISSLRNVLAETGAEIETRAPGYILRTEPESIDILRFRRLIDDGVSAARSGDPASEDTLQRAVAMAPAEPLSDFMYESFFSAAIREINELKTDAIEVLASLHLDAGDYESARRLARDASTIEPLREGPRRVAMVSLCRSGRYADALREYGTFHALLAEELGIEPSEQLRELEERILLQDHDLAPAQVEGPTAGNPYRGLQPFTQADSEFYFGREALVDELVARLVDGTGLVSIVGPSGSGKSSLARAGIVPALEARGEQVVVIQPGAQPMMELADALSRVGLGPKPLLAMRLTEDSSSLPKLAKGTLNIVVDQFEELFTLASDEAARTFAGLLATSLEGAAVRFVVTLRADFFDRPLSMPELAAMFARSTVSLAPLTPTELERAIVEPAGRVGRQVDPDLLAQLVADMAHAPGALPLLQFSLFEVFNRSEGSLTLQRYRDLGGIQGALSQGADEVVEELNDRSRELVAQIFLRLVQKDRGGVSSRPTPVRELLNLGVDRLELLAILEVFADRRLVTFGRDASGVAVVEIAHEYLIEGWSGLSRWIVEHDEDLDRLAELMSPVRDWVESGRSDDYLFRGDRLDRMADWRGRTNLALTILEQEFLEAAVELRDRPVPPPDMVVWYEGRGDGSFGDLVGAGIDLARDQLGVDIAEYNEHLSQLPQIEAQIARGTRLVFLLYLIARDRDVLAMINRHPLTHFAVFGASRSEMAGLANDNVSFLNPKNEEMGFLAGMAAGLVSKTYRAGFIGGVDTPAIRRFHAGYEQGAAYVDPGCGIDAIYLTGTDEFGTDMSGFHSTTLGFAAARHLRESGADVLFHAAGGSGWGMFSYARSHLRETGEPTWCIGIDVDQREELAKRAAEWGFDEESKGLMRSQILTSIAWRLDIAIRDMIADFLENGSVSDRDAAIVNGHIEYAGASGVLQVFQAALDAGISSIKDGSLSMAIRPQREPDLLVDRLG